MVRVAPVKLQVGTKVLWFDPTDLDIHADDHVIVDTERGHEYGTATSDVIEVSDELIAELKSPLKPVLRIATPEDEQLAAELAVKGEEALPVFRQMAEESHVDMHPVQVEFLMDGDKAIFYFESEERVDFRDLVRKLASHFHVRVDMRQIGVRDAARMVGGLGHCGQELCCCRLGGEFNPVSIRMAKEQNLSLNPQKISGVCGRLMCCLRYEYETYKEFNSRAPKLNAKVDVPGGQAKVTEVNCPCETISLRLADGKTVKVPLAEFEEPEEGRRPHVISEATYEKYTQDNSLEKLGTALFEVTSFTGEEKLADPTRRPRQRKPERQEQAATAPKERKSTSGRKPRRRTRAGRTGAEEPEVATTAAAPKEGAAKPAKPAKPARTKVAPKREEGKQPTEDRKREGSSRRRRRRSSGSAAGHQPAQQPKAAEPAKPAAARPGRKSSGLRAAENRAAKPAEAPKKTEGAASGAKRAASSHRRPRRRRGGAGRPEGNGASAE